MHAPEDSLVFDSGMGNSIIPPWGIQLYRRGKFNYTGAGNSIVRRERDTAAPRGILRSGSSADMHGSLRFQRLGVAVHCTLLAFPEASGIRFFACFLLVWGAFLMDFRCFGSP